MPGPAGAECDRGVPASLTPGQRPETERARVPSSLDDRTRARAFTGGVPYAAEDYSSDFLT